jgi:RIO kinase 2
MQLIVRLASQGLIHGDYNEFNILVYEDGRPILIDFPQMISIDHPNAREYFERDVECIKTYFLKKYRFEADEAPQWEDVERVGKLDHEVKASGYGGKLGKQMEWFHREVSAVTNNQRGDNNAEDTDSDEEEEDEDEEAEEIVESEEGDEDSDRGNYEEEEEEEKGEEGEEEADKQGRNL